MPRDIYKLTDDLSLEIQQVFDATENAVKMEVNKALLNGSSKATSKKDYQNSQIANDKNFKKALNDIAEESTTIIRNVVTNISNYMAVDQKPLLDTMNRGTKLLIQSGIKKKDSVLKRVLRLEDFDTSGKYADSLKESLINTLTSGQEIQSVLPVRYTNGRMVPYKSYMEMAFRTGVQQEVGKKQIQIGGQNNVCFYAVNEFADCADDHAAYQGKIYYDERFESFPIQQEIKDQVRAHIKSKNMLSVQQVRDGKPFLTTRPNCRHRMLPLTIGQVLNLTLDEIKDKFSLSYGSYNDENYQDLKQQRYLERQIRRNKLNAEIALNTYNQALSNGFTPYQVSPSLIKAQQYRRKVLLYQKKQRELMKKNPFLQRDYRRETANTILGDVGITGNFNVSGNYINPSWYVGASRVVKPSLRASDLTPLELFKESKGETPRNFFYNYQDRLVEEVLEEIALEESIELPDEVKEHYNIPKEDQIIETSSGAVRGRNLIPDIAKDTTDPIKFLENMGVNPKTKFINLIDAQKYKNKPTLAKGQDFLDAYEKSDFILTRGYVERRDISASKMRKEFEEGEFFVDNVGGAVYGRGMYFAMSVKEKEESKYNFKDIYGNEVSVNTSILSSMNTAVDYAGQNEDGVKPENARIDVAVLKPEARIANRAQLVEEMTQNILDQYSTNSKVKETIRYNKFKKKYEEKARKVHNKLNKELRTSGDLEYFTFNNIGSTIIDETPNEEYLERKYEKNYSVDITSIKKYDKKIKEQVRMYDEGLMATMLGYDGIIADNGSYFVLLNRSMLVVADDGGKVSKSKLKNYEYDNDVYLTEVLEDVSGVDLSEKQEDLPETTMTIIGEEDL